MLTQYFITSKRLLGSGTDSKKNSGCGSEQKGPDPTGYGPAMLLKTHEAYNPLNPTNLLILNEKAA
jgi:hypothetical protein